MTIAIMLITPFWNHIADSYLNSGRAPSASELPSGSTPTARQNADTHAGSSNKTPTSSCVDPKGAPASCADSGALLLTSADSCTPAGAAAALAAPDGLNLDLAATSLPTGRCAVGPGPVAQAAGANTEDVHAIASGSISSTLTLCQQTVTSLTDVACTSPHNAEAVGAWSPWARDAVERCIQSVGVFTGRAANVPGDSIRPQVAERTKAGKVSTRCFIVSTEPLSNTVFHVNGGRLPHVS